MRILLPREREREKWFTRSWTLRKRFSLYFFLFLPFSPSLFLSLSSFFSLSLPLPSQLVVWCCIMKSTTKIGIPFPSSTVSFWLLSFLSVVLSFFLSLSLYVSMTIPLTPVDDDRSHWHFHREFVLWIERREREKRKGRNGPTVDSCLSFHSTFHLQHIIFHPSLSPPSFSKCQSSSFECSFSSTVREEKEERKRREKRETEEKISLISILVSSSLTLPHKFQQKWFLSFFLFHFSLSYFLLSQVYW